LPRRPQDIDPIRLAELEAGRAETRDLAEGLAIRMDRLAAAVWQEWGLEPPIDRRFQETVTHAMAAGGLALALLGDEAVTRAMTHSSDTVRGWAAYAIGERPGWTLEQRLARVRVLAADPHFAVREWAWLGLRPRIAAEIATALNTLADWTKSEDPNVRRFACEATRPRGVWCAHIGWLKTNPEPGLVILEPLRADPAKYVQDSVANWLNDAAKSHPGWVMEVTERWQNESPGPVTARIVRRARRSMKT
jgi:3-methyladenine DNA glycosylase AlkC